ncbi:hypothetical protein F0562_010943 [Nyssa sinensis]|uniref:non-specific serine/threonine protein kinase n=1 Tax=Nyssa sinensis TaxID=561372 RepID=A0A5J5A241_9ASTE|nr:hypothetical protein F0562_010943 [Nyssa sinensis]
MPETKCDFYGHYGLGVCERNGSAPLCKYLTGFKPKFQKDWVVGNWTRGCERRTALRCDKGDGFMRFGRMKLPDYSFSLGNMSVSECEFKCLRNCSCTAYAYANFSGETSVNCLNWYGDLIDLVHNHLTGQDLYVRLHGSEVVGNGQTGKLMDRKIAIAAVSLFIGLLFICGFGYALRRKRLRWQERTSGFVHVVNSMSGTSRVRQNDTELLSFSLQTILSATDNFSEENKLGEGGFGPVYKGNLPGLYRVAMKRLSKNSLQGFEEFTNELKLITKLQHTNLVRLMGCCIEGEEKILIYEFMPNRSLDKFLFNPSEQSNLDWRKCFHIIGGIAQGLLYLHKYSRFKRKKFLVYIFISSSSSTVAASASVPGSKYSKGDSGGSDTSDTDIPPKLPCPRNHFYMV